MKKSNTIIQLGAYLDDLLRHDNYLLLEDSDKALVESLIQRGFELNLPDSSTNQSNPPSIKSKNTEFVSRPATDSKVLDQASSILSNDQKSQSSSSNSSHLSENKSTSPSLSLEPKNIEFPPSKDQQKTERPTTRRNILWKDEKNILEAPNIELLNFRVRGCERCGLHQERTNLVFGQGSANAKAMFIGEGPGETEDKEGLAFVGKSGQLLTQLLLSIGIPREDIYIANIVKCRPIKNRNPEPPEVAACDPILKRQIELINPKLIVALGSVALNNLVSGSLPGITKIHGELLKCRIGQIDLIPTYHPSFLLRDPARLYESWDDFRKIRKHLGKSQRTPA